MSPETDKITIVNRAHAGQELILPEIGKVALNGDGEIEVSTYVATQMVELGSGWAVKGDNGTVNDELLAALRNMTLEDMVVLAEKAQIEPEKFKKFRTNETLMRNFLKKNLDALKDAAAA